MKIDFSSGCIIIEVQLSIYSWDVLHKCFYWYSDKFDMEMEEKNGSGFIKLLYDKEIMPEQLRDISHQIHSDLIDYKNRDIVTKETKNIRDLLVAKAFSHIDHYDEMPKENVSDQVGYNPLD